MTECSFERLFPLLKNYRYRQSLEEAELPWKGLSGRALSAAAGVSARRLRCLSEASFADDGERRMRSSEIKPKVIKYCRINQNRRTIAVGGCFCTTNRRTNVGCANS